MCVIHVQIAEHFRGVSSLLRSDERLVAGAHFLHVAPPLGDDVICLYSLVLSMVNRTTPGYCRRTYQLFRLDLKSVFHCKELIIFLIFVLCDTDTSIVNNQYIRMSVECNAEAREMNLLPGADVHSSLLCHYASMDHDVQ